MRKPKWIDIKIDWIENAADVFFSDEETRQRNRGTRYAIVDFSPAYGKIRLKVL